MSDGLNREGFTEPQPAMTPGQAACVAWNSHYAEQHGIEARNEWAASDPRGRVAWEAAAIAGHNAFAARPAPELAAAMAEREELCEKYARLLDKFAKGSDGYRARLSGVVLAREYRSVGRPVPDHLRHLEGQ